MAEVRLIDANLIVKFIQDGLNNPDKEKAFGHDAIEILAEIECNAPTIDPDSLRPKGRWIVKPLDCTEDLLLPHCSECDTPHARERNFCNECGAKMGGARDGD